MCPGLMGSQSCSQRQFSRPQLVSRTRPHPAWERRPLLAACPRAGPPSRQAAPPGAQWSPQPCPGPPGLTLRPLQGPQGQGGRLWWCESPPSQGPAAKPRPGGLGACGLPTSWSHMHYCRAQHMVSHRQVSPCHAHKTCQRCTGKTLPKTATPKRQPQHGCISCSSPLLLPKMGVTVGPPSDFCCSRSTKPVEAGRPTHCSPSVLSRMRGLAAF